MLHRPVQQELLQFLHLPAAGRRALPGPQPRTGETARTVVAATITWPPNTHNRCSAISGQNFPLATRTPGYKTSTLSSVRKARSGRTSGTEMTEAFGVKLFPGGR